MAISTESDLAEALRRGEPYIEVEGDLANKTFKIKAVGPVAWVVALGAVSVGVILAVPSGGSAGAIASGSVISIVGVGAAYTMVRLVKAGGTESLTSLRDRYEIVDRSDGRMKLKRK